MASAYVQSKSNNGTSTPGTPTVTLTSAPIAGHVLVAFIFSGGAETTISISGWNNGTAQSNVNVAGRAFWKVSDGSEQTVTGSLSTARAWSMTVLEYSGVNNTTPELAENSSANSAGTRITGTASPASGANGMLVGVRGVKANSTCSAETLITSNVGTVTEREDANTAANGSIAAWDANVTSTSGSYSGAWTDSSGSTSVGAIIVLQDFASVTGAAARPITFSSVVAGIRKTFGVIARPQVFTYAVAGIRKTFGVVARGQVVTFTAAGVRKTFGVAARAQTFTIHAAGVRKTFGVVARPITFAATVAGVRTATGAAARSIVLSFTAAGVVTPGTGGDFGPGSVGFMSTVSRGAIAKGSAGDLAGSSLGGVS